MKSESASLPLKLLSTLSHHHSMYDYNILVMSTDLSVLIKYKFNVHYHQRPEFCLHSRIYIYIYILSKIIAFPLLHLVLDVLLGTSYCGINIRSMLDHVDLRLFYLNGKIIIYGP